MKGIYLDSETAVTAEVFAVVYVPGRHRKRYPETNVTVMDSAASAMAQAEPNQRCYAARVMGPARSSEGVKLYYLVGWLDDNQP
ncbi:hypothetical protein MNBD_GAMMA25-1394 [hydrothermal vent metagenome]|uniref:Uncharacterized protein n=1 Tax=hydrothermal vent metagenome TaxID=652676 RepID=A0A3B1BEY6_9ZZZZ